MGGQLGYVFASFLLSLLCAMVWIIIARLTGMMKKRLGLAYAIAIPVAFLPAFVSLGSLLLNCAGAMLAVAVVGWRYWAEVESRDNAVKR